MLNPLPYILIAVLIVYLFKKFNLHEYFKGIPLYAIRGFLGVHIIFFLIFLGLSMSPYVASWFLKVIVFASVVPPVVFDVIVPNLFMKEVNSGKFPTILGFLMAYLLWIGVGILVSWLISKVKSSKNT